LISGRVLKQLLDNGVKGFFRRYTDPPVKFQVVEIRGDQAQPDEAKLLKRPADLARGCATNISKRKGFSEN